MGVIRLSKSVVDEEEVRATTRVLLNDGYLGMGKDVQCFEQELKTFLGTDGEVVCVNSGTAALHLAVALAVAPGEEVLVQSLTYVSSFQAISAAGAVPIACEVDPKSVTLDLLDAEARITQETKAIMPVHYAGNPGNLDQIYDFANAHGLRVIEDAAHAFGTVYKGSLVGARGDIVCFSFDGIKNITSGEGGAVVTSDSEALRYVRDARLLGVKRDTEQRYKGLRSWEFDVTQQGYRYHMSNLFAAIGLAQLKKFSNFKKARQALAARYDKILKAVKGVVTFDIDYGNVVPHIYPVRVQGNHRDGLRQYLMENGVETGVHYYPNHRLTLFAKRGVVLPVTDKLYGELISLPLHPDLTHEQQDKITTLIAEYMEGRGSK